VEARRSALIIATDEYEDARLRRLRAPARDAEELGRVLADDAIGGFDVEILHNEPEYSVRRKLAQFFADRNREDLLLVHFSCHGLKDDDGTLYFATPDTEMEHLDSTAVPSDFVNRQMQRSRSRRIALFLDCCYSGAFSRGAMARAGDGVQLAERFDGQGQVVITASNAMEYAFEGDELTGAGTPSVFTTAIVEGLESGEADRDGDDLVSIDELYDYVYERVREQTPGQTPSKWTYDLQGELYVARNPRPRPVTPAELPIELRQALESPLTPVRLGIIGELERMASGSNPRLASAARLALEDLVDDDSRAVSAAATEALERSDTAEEAKPAAPAKPQTMKGTVRAPSSFAAPGPVVATPRAEPETRPRWWPFRRVSIGLVVLALGLVGAAVMVGALWSMDEGQGGGLYALGVAAAATLATVLASLRQPISPAACGALLAMGFLSAAAPGSFHNPGSGDAALMVAGVLILAAGVIGVAVTASIRSQDWTSSVIRSRVGALAALLSFAGAGLCTAVFATTLAADFRLVDEILGDGDRLTIIVIVLGVAGLALMRLAGASRLIAAGVLVGAGLQAALFFGGLAKAWKYFDKPIGSGTILGIAGGAALIAAGWLAYVSRDAASTSR
jgi:hypothetical protein